MCLICHISRLYAEDMLAAVAHATGEQIGVSVERLQTISIAGLPEELFTADMSAARIRYTDCC